MKHFVRQWSKARGFDLRRWRLAGGGCRPGLGISDGWLRIHLWSISCTWRNWSSTKVYCNYLQPRWTLPEHEWLITRFRQKEMIYGLAWVYCAFWDECSGCASRVATIPCLTKLDSLTWQSDTGFHPLVSCWQVEELPLLTYIIYYTTVCWDRACWLMG